MVAAPGHDGAPGGFSWEDCRCMEHRPLRSDCSWRRREAWDIEASCHGSDRRPGGGQSCQFRTTSKVELWWTRGGGMSVWGGRPVVRVSRFHVQVKVVSEGATRTGTCLPTCTSTRTLPSGTLVANRPPTHDIPRYITWYIHYLHDDAYWTRCSHLRVIGRPVQNRSCRRSGPVSVQTTAV